MTSSRDAFGAFVPYHDVEVAHAADGPLAGLSLGVKDLFDVAGYPTGCGHPLKLAQSPIAAVSAPPVQALLDAGIRFEGKTHMDELAYSANGVNHHYGAPINASAPDCITGGSSSGSAAAVAAGLVDVGLGSDTGGSVRLPASYCGLFGIRPTHGAVSLDAAMPLAQSFDTAGWFTRQANLLRRVGDVLLPPDKSDASLSRLLIAEDAFALLPDDAKDAFASVLDRLRERFADIKAAALFPEDSADRRPVFRTAQGYETWQAHGAWITRFNPELGSDVGNRFRIGSTIGRDDYTAANKERLAIRRLLEEVLQNDGLILLPTTVNAPPSRHSSYAALEDIRSRMQQVLCIASLTGHPQVSIPAASIADLPLGLSLLGPRTMDRALLLWTEKISAALSIA